MTFVPINFDDIVEAQPAAAGRYELQILEAKIAYSGPNSANPGSPQFRVTLGFVDPLLKLDHPTITHFISIPNETEDPEKAKFKAKLIKRFLVAFKIPHDPNGIDTEALPMNMLGASAFMEVGLSDVDDNGNVYNRLQVPRLKTETGRRPNR
ncbi:MAG: hypothetical protein DDT31_00620 [Syntrophomonadaceae bacterium]|nr:hypothetical protein [Bacillota bacterium]